jgi:hypothetical protein
VFTIPLVAVPLSFARAYIISVTVFATTVFSSLVAVAAMLSAWSALWEVSLAWETAWPLWEAAFRPLWESSRAFGKAAWEASWSLWETAFRSLWESTWAFRKAAWETAWALWETAWSLWSAGAFWETSRALLRTGGGSTGCRRIGNGLAAVVLNTVGGGKSATKGFSTKRLYHLGRRIELTSAL